MAHWSAYGSRVRAIFYLADAIFDRLISLRTMSHTDGESNPDLLWEKHEFTTGQLSDLLIFLFHDLSRTRDKFLPRYTTHLHGTVDGH